jgi:hypothetical protein
MTDVNVPDALRAAPAIDLATLNEHSALQDRLDSKFVLARSDVEQAVAELVAQHGYLVLEIEGERAFTYRSVYYDTADRRSYRDHVQRRRQRFKVRTRHYVESGVQRFEVKVKGPRGRTIKHARAIDGAYAGFLPAAATEFVDETLMAQYRSTIREPLKEVLHVEYTRATLVSPDGLERVTCDWDLSLHNTNGGEAGLRGDQVLVETKSVVERGVAWDVLKRHGARPVSCSKYAAGIALTERDAKHNDLLRLLRRSFEVREPSVVRDVREISHAS